MTLNNTQKPLSYYIQKINIFTYPLSPSLILNINPQIGTNQSQKKEINETSNEA